MDDNTLTRMIAGILLLGFGFGFYFLPYIVERRNGSKAGKIPRLNLFGGWSVIGWIAAPIRALMGGPVPAITTQQSVAPTVLCPTCGRYSIPGRMFCSKCGQPLDRAAIAMSYCTV
jgi:ribosomal protein L32